VERRRCIPSRITIHQGISTYLLQAATLHVLPIEEGLLIAWWKLQAHARVLKKERGYAACRKCRPARTQQYVELEKIPAIQSCAKHLSQQSSNWSPRKKNNRVRVDNFYFIFLLEISRITCIVFFRQACTASTC
jgi:hypothetical protein